jgi:hypothetical protein
MAIFLLELDAKVMEQLKESMVIQEGLNSIPKMQGLTTARASG